MKTKNRKNKTFIISLLYSLMYFILCYFLATIPAEFYQAAFHLKANQAQNYHLFIFFFCHALCALVGFALFRPLLKVDWQKLKTQLFKTILLVVFAFIVMLIGSSFLSFLPSANQDAINAALTTSNAPIYWLFTLTICFLGPWNEELFFRQVLIGAFDSIVPKWILVLISALFFGIIHIPSLAYFPQSLPYIWNGFILSLVYIYKEDNVLRSYSLHALNNIMSIIL